MSTILHLQSSIYGADSASIQLGEALVSHLAGELDQARIIRRDLGASNIPHLNATTHQAFAVPPEQRGEAEHKALALSDTLIAELRAADYVVIGAPMYNFGIPSELKAWIDHIARVGETFNYTSAGPKGLLDGKKTFVISTRGGKYAGTDGDNQTPYLRQALGFLGLDQPKFIYAEGLAMSSQQHSALAKAEEQISQIEL